jgi:hypothetical protein
MMACRSAWSEMPGPRGKRQAERITELCHRRIGGAVIRHVSARAVDRSGGRVSRVPLREVGVD